MTHDDQNSISIKKIAADVICAYLSNNFVSVSGLPALIASIEGSFHSLTGDELVDPVTDASKWPTANQIQDSITPSALISFIDGKPYKTLQRHLAAHGLTPKSYRDRFDLPYDYPMSCPEYSAKRSAIAVDMKLGHPGLANKRPLLLPTQPRRRGRPRKER